METHSIIPTGITPWTEKPGKLQSMGSQRAGQGRAHTHTHTPCSRYCCRKGDPFQGPKLGSCLTLGNELSEETHVMTKQELLLGKGTRVESRRVREPRTPLPRGLGFMVMGLVSGLSLANHSDSESFLMAHALFSQDGCHREGFWEVVGHALSPFDLYRTLPVRGGLLVPCSLPEPPVIKQMVTMVPGQGGPFQSECFP